MTVWRLLDTGHMTAAENMALNQALLECHSRGLTPVTLHFLQFAPHCVLVGYHQSVALEVEEDYCLQHGIDINRRITGGGNLYWDESQLGWELYANRHGNGMPNRLETLYEKICHCCIAGLAQLGVEAQYRPKNDIEVGGRKISGTGGKQWGEAFLYQGTLLTDFDVDTMIAALKLPLIKTQGKDVANFRQRVISLRDIQGDRLSTIAEIKRSIAAGFEQTFGIRLEPKPLLPVERARFLELLPQFQSDKWIYGDRGAAHNDLRVYNYKCKGGLIRVSMRIDFVKRIIKAVFITGDFFIEPSHWVPGLEASLKSFPLDISMLRAHIDQYVREHPFKAPYLKPSDLCEAIMGAVKDEEAHHEAV